MAARQTIKQRIAFEGGEAMKDQLEALGEVGEKAFKKIASASTQAEFAKLGSSLKRVGDDLATVGKRLALGYAAVTTAASAAAASVVLLAKNSAMVVTEAGRAAQVAGLQVDAYGRLAFAAEAAYISQGDLQAGLSRLNKELGAAASGNKASADKFKVLGVAVRDANGRMRPTEAIVRDLAQAFARMPDSAKKSALAMEVFGKSGASLIPFLNQGAAGLKELGEKAEGLGVVFSADQLKIGDALRTALDDLSTAIKGARVQLGLLIAPSVTRGANQLRDTIVQNRKAILDLANRAVAPAALILKDFIFALSGQDAQVESAWIIEWRDGVIQFGKDAYAAHRVVIPAFDAIRKAASGVADAISSMFGIGLSGDQILLIATLFKLVGGFAVLRSSVMAAVQAITLLSRVFWANPWTAVLAGVATGIGLWATRTSEATTALQAHESLVNEVRNAYDEAGQSVANMTEEVKRGLFVKTVAELEKAQAAIESAFSSAAGELFIARQNEVFGELIQQFIDGKKPVADFIKEINDIVWVRPELAGVAQELTDVVEPLKELTDKQSFKTDFLDVLTGNLSEAEFKARHMKRAINDATVAVKEAGTAAADTSAKVEELGKTITVTKFGSDGPVKQVYDLADGVARAVDKSKIEMDELGLSAEKTGATVEKVTSGVATAIRSLPQELRGQTTPAEAMTEGLDEAGTQVQQVATEISTATTAAKQGVEALGESWVETNRQAASALSEMPDSAKAAVDALAAEVSRIPAIMAEVQGSQALADAILEPFQKLTAAIDGIMAGIRDTAQNGFTSLIGIVRQLAGEIDAMITRIIAALRQAAAEAAKLRASGSSSSSSSSRSPGHRLAGGGHLSHGPGTSTSDSIPAWLSLGEFVTQAKAVAYYGPGLFHALNKMLLPKDFLKGIRGFNLGGLADGIRSSLSNFSIPQFAGGGLNSVALAPAGVSGRPVVLQLPGGQMIPGFTGTDDAVAQLQRHAAGKAMTSAGRKPGWYR